VGVGINADIEGGGVGTSPAGCSLPSCCFGGMAGPSSSSPAVSSVPAASCPSSVVSSTSSSFGATNSVEGVHLLLGQSLTAPGCFHHTQVNAEIVENTNYVCRSAATEMVWEKHSTTFSLLKTTNRVEGACLLLGYTVTAPENWWVLYVYSLIGVYSCRIIYATNICHCPCQSTPGDNE